MDWFFNAFWGYLGYFAANLFLAVAFILLIFLLFVLPVVIASWVN
jgi:hypothetical protein